MKALLEPELCALAAKVSWEEGNREVRLSELAGHSVSYDGPAFAEFYRKQKYPNS